MPMTPFRGLDLQTLVILQCLLEERSLSAVARRLGLSQPAVSHALRRLREALGDELFVRTGAGMAPTPRAEQLAGLLGEALSLLAQLRTQPDGFEPQHSTRRFRLAMTDVGELHFMPTLIRQVARLAPGVRLESVRLAGADLRRELERGAVDVAVGAFVDLGDAVYQRRLFQQGYRTLFRRGHPTAHAGMSAAEFVAAEHLLVARAAPQGQVNQALAQAGVVLAAHTVVPFFGAVPAIVAETDLLATVPQRLAESVAERFGLDLCVPPVPIPELQTYLFWSRRFQRDAGSQWLRETLVQCFAGHALPEGSAMLESRSA